VADSAAASPLNGRTLCGQGKRALMKPTIFFCVVLFSCGCLPAAQELVTSSNGCTVRDGVKPSVFISYEAATGPYNDKTKTILRLHNNTDCNIVVETSDIVPPPPEYSDLFKTETKTLPNGLLETRFIPDPPEGALVPIYYDKQQTRKQKPRPANYWEGRDLIFEYTIPGGRSVTFPVDARLFRKRFLISVPFSYEWEHHQDLRTLGTVEHRVFYFYDLPTGYYVPD
jgi:hypothetical protein